MKLSKSKHPNEKSQELTLHLRAISHEFKNPLTTIEGFASLLDEEYGNLLPQGAKHYLDRIFFNLKRAQNLLEDLSELAGITIEEENFEHVSSHELVEAAVEPFLFIIKKQAITLSIQDDLPHIYCDVKAMIQVFTNLISNAIKYSRPGKPNRIEIGYEGDEIFHKFYVKDQGIGIAEKDRNKVFVLFSRLRRKREVAGSGIGLAIVKRIIEGHGGEIWVDSRLNKGSTFFFTLPKI